MTKGEMESRGKLHDGQLILPSQGILNHLEDESISSPHMKYENIDNENSAARVLKNPSP